jgi:hypothetical protein
VLLACAVAGALLCFGSIRDTTAQNDIAKSQIREMDAEVRRLKGEGEKVQQQLSPEQRALLISAHRLVANKSFGWSRLFADLNRFCPAASAHRASASKTFTRKTTERKRSSNSKFSAAIIHPEMTMIERMNSSGIFQAELRGQDLQKKERFTYTEYNLRLIYTPPYGYSPRRKRTLPKPSKGGNQ